ncbi:MAG: biotin/lipoyl-containing protein, partial [Pseudomonadota bacterium]
MGVTGRKLTIRMPDHPRLRTAEVGSLHLDPGARVQSGNPVLTLVHRRREHKVRAPRSGRVVPLIAAGDRVSAGDPLFVLHIDEAALDAQNREEKALIAVEKEKWTSGVLADAIEPVQRARPRPDDVGSPEFVASWGKPILALALYVLACFALLPILHLFGKTASMPVVLAMVVGCIAFSALIFYLYAPGAGKWPRRTVQLISASWIAISSIALFYHPSETPAPGVDVTPGP